MSPAQRALPQRIQCLHDLASNLWWSWTPAAREVFRRLDYPLWRRTHHNPLQMLNLVTAERFEEVARDAAFLETYDTAIEKLLRTPSQESARGGRAARRACLICP